MILPSRYSGIPSLQSSFVIVLLSRRPQLVEFILGLLFYSCLLNLPEFHSAVKRKLFVYKFLSSGMYGQCAVGFKGL